MLRRAGFDPGPDPRGSALPGATTVLLPLGVVGVRAPSQVIPALAAGNAVVLVATGVFNLVDGGDFPPHGDVDLLRAPPAPPVTLRLDDLDDDEAIRRAGSADRVALFAADLGRALRLAAALRAEHVWINAPPADVADAPERYTRRQTIYAG